MAHSFSPSGLKRGHRTNLSVNPGCGTGSPGFHTTSPVRFRVTAIAPAGVTATPGHPLPPVSSNSAATGMVMATLFAWLTLMLATKQVATGLALSIFGAGLSAFIGQRYVGYALPSVSSHIPFLGDLPLVGLQALCVACFLVGRRVVLGQLGGLFGYFLLAARQLGGLLVDRALAVERLFKALQLPLGFVLRSRNVLRASAHQILEGLVGGVL